VSEAESEGVGQSVALRLDHLVVAAATLSEGLAWCERALGVSPAAGGQHLFMGTHNRVFDISSAAFPRSYLEIIAIDPTLAAPAHARWFDLDNARLQQQLRQHGPQLVHWVARCGSIHAARGAMAELGLDCGVVTPAQRGALRWQITLREDGQRALSGAAPALIEWADVHPTDGMKSSGVTLTDFRVAAPSMRRMLTQPIGSDSPGPLHAVFDTPRGRVELKG